jgi:Uma2 family endonuclease
MNLIPTLPDKSRIEYPDKDGRPISDNTLQFQWIVTIKEGLEAVFRDDSQVFVAGDLLWYPVEGDNTIRTAPDTMVVFGRPKGHRGSYQQWREDGVPPQVVFEVLSPGNRFGELLRKFNFYSDYGVEEYYLYDPEEGDLEGWQRQGNRLSEIESMKGWVSPRLKVRFDLDNEGNLKLFGPDGRPFATYLELIAQRDQAERERDQAEQRVKRLEEQLRKLGAEPEK